MRTPAWLRFLLPAALLAGLGVLYASRVTRMDVGFARCVATPVACEDRLLAMPLWQVSSVAPGRLHLTKLERDVPVEALTEGISVGDTVSVTGRFDPARRVVVAETLEVHHLRRWKTLLGGVGTAGSLLYLGAALRRSRRSGRG